MDRRHTTEGKDPDRIQEISLGGQRGDPRDRLVLLAVGFYGLLLLLALAWRSGIQGASLLYADASAAASGLRPLGDAAAGLACGVALVVISRRWTRATAAGASLAHSLRTLLGERSAAEVLVLAATSGLAEEALFRGALQPNVGLVAASLIFGLAHFVPRRELLAWAPAALLAGFALGGLFAWTGNLVAPVVAHFVVNAANLYWLSRRDPPPGLAPEVVPPLP